MIRPANAFWLWVLDRLWVDGLTLPWGVVYIRPTAMGDAGLIEHERVHLEQIARMGAIKFSLVYLWQLWRYGYDRMPLELEAIDRQYALYDRGEA